MAGQIPWITMIVFLSVLAATSRRGQAPVDEAAAAERRRKFRATAVLVAAAGALAYAALLGIMSLALLHDLTFGRGPRSWPNFLLLPTAAAGSVAFGWAGLRLLRDKGLPGRLARAWAAAVEAFHEPAPDETKPKPSRSEYDLS